MTELTFDKLQISKVFRKSRTSQNKKTQTANQFGEIYFRIQVSDQSIVEVSTKVNCIRSNWESNKGRMKGRDESSRILNQNLVDLENRIRNIYSDLLKKNESISSQLIKDAITGDSNKKNDLIKGYAKWVLMNKDIHAGTTHKHYNTTLKYLKLYLSDNYNRDSIPVKLVDYEFVYDFGFWILKNTNCNNNGASKHHYRLRTYLNHVKRARKILYNPYDEYEVKKDKTETGYLEKNEVDEIRNLTLAPGSHLEKIKDGFLFSIYTGLSFGDFERITRDKINLNSNNLTNLRERRIKTGEPFIVPIWDDASSILEKYSNHPDVINKNILIPTISNQKFNENLKTIAKMCGIKKNLTHHMARHTFATYYILEEKRMSIEALRIMLGHTNIKMTQLYGKLTENRLATEVIECKERELKAIA